MIRIIATLVVSVRGLPPVAPNNMGPEALAAVSLDERKKE
jgi:hypothetical protein